MKKFTFVILILSVLVYVGACNSVKKTANKVADGTKKATTTVADGTKTAAQKTAEGTKKAAKKTAEGTKKAASKTADGTKKAATAVTDGAKKVFGKDKNKAEEAAKATTSAPSKKAETAAKEADAKAEMAEGKVKAATETAEAMAPVGSIKFAAANERYSADGTFKKWKFTKVDMKDSNIETLSASLDVNLASIWEKSPKLTDHLKAPDFFNIEKFTTATIDIDNVTKTGDNTYTADMFLNMKGLTQEMKSEFTVTSTDPLHVKGTAEVNRKLFGLGSDGMGVGELVKVSYDTDIPQ